MAARWQEENVGNVLCEGVSYSAVCRHDAGIEAYGEKRQRYGGGMGV